MRQLKNYILLFIVLVFAACGGKSSTSDGAVISNPDSNTSIVTYDGYVIDNYLEDATVCLDTNKNNDCSDEIEKYVTTTDANGYFKFEITKDEDKTFQVVAYFGEDIKTKEKFELILKNTTQNKDSNGKVILSSFTTLITEVQNTQKKTLSESKEIVHNFLGGDANNIEIENLSEDLIALKDTQSDEFLKSLKVLQMVDNTLSENTPTASHAVFASLAKTISEDTTLTDTSSLIEITLDGVTKNLYLENTIPVFVEVPTPNVKSGEKLVVNLEGLAFDPNGEDLTYSVLDNDALEVIDNKLYLKESATYNESGENNYSLTLQASNGTFTKDLEIMFTILDSNENNPVITLNANLSALENQTALVNVEASDADNNPLTYSLSGTDATAFNISSTGVVTFKTAPDFETKDTYSLSVTVSDGVNEVSKDVTVSISDVNEAPEISSSSIVTVLENQTSLISIVAHVDAGETLTYTLSGVDSSSFQIDTNGVITFVNNPDYELKSSYSLTVTVNDGSNEVSQNITVTLSDENEVPVITSNNTATVAENQTAVLDVDVSTDAGETLTYLLGGTDASDFEISTSGVLTFKNTPDFESKDSYSLTVTVSDGTNDVSQNISVNITNVNETSPVISSSNSVTVAENQTSALSVVASDADTSESLTYSLSGTDANAFDISTSGVITFKTAPDYETKDFYSLSVTVSDGTNDVSQNITVTISNEDDVVPVLEDTNITINENINIGTVIGDINVTASGDSNITSFNISDETYFMIENNGTIKVNGTINYEQYASHELNVTATNDAGESENIVLTITVNDIFEIGVPTDINITSDIDSIQRDTTAYIDEEGGANLFVGTFSSDGGSSSFTFSLIAGAGDTDNGSFEINASNRLYLTSNANYENQTSYDIRVQVEDNESNLLVEQFTVEVNNINDVAVFTTTPSSLTVLQNGSFTYVANIQDEDVSQTLTVLTHTIPANFEVNGTSGDNTNDVNISVRDLALGDGMVGNHDFTLRVREDNTSSTIEQSFTVTVQDVNDAPVCDSCDLTKRTLDFGGENIDIDFDINDGDQAQSQSIAINISSSDPSVATVPVSLTAVVDSDTISIPVTPIETGEANITVTLQDNGGTANSGVNILNFTFEVEVRPTGWKLYNERKNSGDETAHDVEIDGITYSWDNTNRWYATASTILMPVKILDSVYYEADNFNKHGAGHYDVNKSDYLNAPRDTDPLGYDPAASDNNFITADGVTTIDSLTFDSFNHDPEHNLFVSMIAKDGDNGNNLTYLYANWTDTNTTDSNGTNYANALDQNTSFTTDINMSSGYANASIQIDYNNDGNSTDSVCAEIYGEGWRLPTSYEIGMDISSGNSGYHGYIPAYVAEAGGQDIISSTKQDTNNNWAFKTHNGRANKFGGLTASIAAKCVYRP